MNSDEVLALVFKKAGHKNVARHLHLSHSLIDQWARPRPPRGSGCHNPLERVDAISCFTGDLRLVQWLCRSQNGYFVHNPALVAASAASKGPAAVDLSAVRLATLKGLSQMETAVLEAALKTEFSAEDSRCIAERWEDLKSVGESFVVCYRNRNFAAYHARAALCRVPGPVRAIESSALAA